MAEQDGFLRGAQTANVDNVPCRDCIYRDRTTVRLFGKDRPVGITRGICDIYNAPGNYKPNSVLLDGLPCEFYRSERDG